MDVCDFDNVDDEDDDDDDDDVDDDDDEEDDDIVYLLQSSVHKFGLHASVDAPLVPDEAQSSFLFLSPLSLLHSLFKCINDEKDCLNNVHKFDER